MDTVLTDFQCGHAKRMALGHARQVLVEQVHEFRRAGIVNIPQRHQQAMSARLEQSSRQTQQFVAFTDRAHSGFAGAQNGQLSAQLQIEDVEEIQPGVTQLE